MDDFWGVTVLLIIILTVFVAFVLRLTVYYKKYHLVRHEKTLLSARLGELKSGDVVLFIGHTHGLTNSLFTGDLYSHSGMVVRARDGGLALTESTIDSLPAPRTGVEEPMAYGAQTTPLVYRLKHYTGSAFLMPLAEPLSEAQEDVLRERARGSAPYPGVGHMLKALAGIGSHDRARHCMQHVAWLLDGMGLAPEGGSLLETGFFGSSRAVTGLPGKPLGPGGANTYGPIRELLYDLEPGP